MRRWIGTGLALLGAAGWPAGALSAPSATDAELEAYESAAAAHPEDPDLAWALALALSREGQYTRAAERLGEFRRRWPGRKLRAPREHARALYEAGRYRLALDAAEEAVAREPDSGEARLYYGMAAWQLDLPQAEVVLRRAAELDPELRPEAMLLIALDRLARGDVDSARSLLHDSAASDASGETADLVRKLLAGRGDPRLRLVAGLGVEQDTNVTLEGNGLLASGASDQDDVRYLGHAGFSLRAFEWDRLSSSVGVRVDQSFHRDLESYDMFTQTAFGSLAWDASEGVRLRLDGVWSASSLDTHPYVRGFSVRPSLWVALPQPLGIAQLFVERTRNNYEGRPAFDSLQRDGVTWSTGLAQYVRVPGWDAATASISARFSRNDTEAGVDLAGFDGAYDHVRWSGAARLEAPLVSDVRLSAGLSYGRERYDHHNVLDLLGGDPTPDRRDDRVLGASVSLLRPLGHGIDLELAWRGTRRSSNVGLYDYNRNVFGIYARVESL